MNLVVGASGTLGSMIVARLGAVGEPVRALVRNEVAAAPSRELGAEDLRISRSFAVWRLLMTRMAMDG